MNLHKTIEVNHTKIVRSYLFVFTVEVPCKEVRTPMNSITFNEERDVEASYGYCNEYQPHAVKRMFDHENGLLYDMRWDEAGNLGQVSMGKPGEMFERGRFLFWTEDCCGPRPCGANRMHTAVDDKHYSYYAYDYGGERRLKLVGDNCSMDVNAEYMNAGSALNEPTLYPSAYMVLTNKGYTNVTEVESRASLLALPRCSNVTERKHYYAGTDLCASREQSQACVSYAETKQSVRSNRVAARLGGGGLEALYHVIGNNEELQWRADKLFKQSLEQVNHRVLHENDLDCIMHNDFAKEEFGYRIDGTPYQTKADISFDHRLFKEMAYLMADDPVNVAENDVYFYHSDHLGSASWITDSAGIAVQHLQYLPYGEPYINQHPYGYSERFTFTGKERDEETGYGYFGARYMDHELMSMWLSVDPMADKYPSISPYAYCAWNPIVLIDPDGNEGIVVSGGEYDGKRYKYNFIEPAITKLKELKSSGSSEPITWLVMEAGYSESDIASFRQIASDLGVGFQTIASADEFTNYINSKNVGCSDLSEARKNDPITSMSIFGHGIDGFAKFAYRQSNDNYFSWGINNIKQLKAKAFNNATVDFYTCNSATNPEKGKSLGYVFSQQTGAVVTGYRGKSTYAKMNVGEGIGAKWDRLWEGFNPNGSVRLPQAGEGAIRIKFLPPVMNGNQ